MRYLFVKVVSYAPDDVCLWSYIYFSVNSDIPSKMKYKGESLGGSAVQYLPLAQGMILESWDESHVRLPAWSLLLSLPVSLPLSLCLMNK